MPTLMERARANLANVLLGSEKEKLERTTRMLYEAYLEGPWEQTPEKLIEQFASIDSSILTDMLLQLGWESYGMGYTLDSSAERQRAVNESRRLWKYSVIAQWIIGLWTSFGLGESIVITPKSEEPMSKEQDEDGNPLPLACVVWDEFWSADRNAALLAEDKIHDKLSNWLLVNGERFLSFSASDQDGECTVRRLPCDEIVEIIKDPNDSATAWWYKRQFSQGGKQNQEWYYPDWSLFFSDDLDKAAEILPQGAIRADEMNMHKDELGDSMGGTTVCVLHIPYTERDESDLRGWPLLSPAGAPWIRAHKKFREDRAAVAAHVAMFVSKLKHKGGSRAGAALAAQMASTLSSSNSFETNPPAVAGSTWVGNDAVDLTRMPLGSGAGDAKADGEGMLLMAGLAGGLYPHWLGAGDAYRLACYSDDTEVLTENGWKSWRHWELGERIATYKHDGKLIEYLEPTNLHIYEYQGQMCHIKGKAIDVLVTPNHRMLAKCENDKNADGSWRDYEVRKAEDLWARFVLPSQAFIEERPDVETFTLPGHTYYCGNHHSERRVPDITIKMDDWLEFLGWWLADGCLHTSSGQVEICQSANSPYAEEIDKMLERTGMDFFKRTSKGGTYFTWGKTSKSLYEWLEMYCGKGALEKHVPEFVFKLNRRQIEVFLAAMWKGDGSFTPKKKRFKGVYTSVSRQLIDDVQILVLYTGDWGRAKLLCAKNQHPEHKQNLAVYRQNRCTRECGIFLDKERNVKMVDYDGVVWCFEAPPNKMFITRRNGFPLIAGNTATSMERPMLLQFSRYRNFWSAQFRKMVKIVLKFHERYNNVTFDTYEAEVSTDQLVQTDAAALTEAVSRYYSDVLVPQLELGNVDTDAVKKITARVSRVVLQAIGVADADDVASDEAFKVGVEDEEEPEEEPAVPPMLPQQQMPMPPMPDEEMPTNRAVECVLENLRTGDISVEQAAEFAILEIADSITGGQ